MSFSSLKKYATCPFSYYLYKVQKVRPAVVDFTETLPGNVAHRLTERVYIAKEKGHPNPQSIFDTDFDEVFDSMVASPAIKLKPGAFASTRIEAKRKIMGWTANLRELLETENCYLPYTLSEFKFGVWQNPLRITDTLWLQGANDLFVANSFDAAGRLIDFKASTSSFHLDFRQLYLYTIALKESKQLTVSMVGFFLFKAKKVEWDIPTKDKLDKTIAWAEDIVRAISAGKFDPDPCLGNCRFCDFRFGACPHAVTVESSGPLSLPSAEKPSILFSVPSL